MPDAFPPPDHRARRWVESVLGRGSRVVRVQRLRGGMTSAIHALDVERRGRRTRVVLRQYVEPLGEWLPSVELEATALDHARAHGVPAPAPIAVGQRADAGYPALLMTFVPGRRDLEPVDFDRWCGSLADLVARVNAVPATVTAFDEYGPWFRWEDPPPPWSKRPHLWERAMEAVATLRPIAFDTFTHRDFHPANVLFRRSAATAIVDWQYTCIGPAQEDASRCRAAIALMFGAREARRFSPTHLDLDPRWDLYQALTFAKPDFLLSTWQEAGRPSLTVPALRRRIERHVELALAELGR